MTWGIQDFVDDKGESNGKYTIQFPNEDYGTANAEVF
jgi:predicted secreted acid phosphatase